jgi:hypothetical protein
MSWLASFFIGALTALLAGTAGGFVAAGCVNWHRISSREGESAYLVVSIVLASAVFGFIAGLVVSRFLPTFFKGFGVASAAILALAGASAWFLWARADIPPTLNGHELMVVVEFRLPKGAARPPVLKDKQHVWFQSGTKFGPPRVSQSGELDTDKARFEQGRWIVPGSARIFTTRGARSVAMALDDKTATGFELPIPRHPGQEYKEWSRWLPDSQGAKWPDTEMSCRFRIEEIVPVESRASADPFHALTPQTPLKEWLRFFDGFGRVPDQYQAILRQAETRPAELAEVLRSSDEEDRGHALDVVQALSAYDPRVVAAMRDVAVGISEQIRKFDGSDQSGERIRQLFMRWLLAWQRVQAKIHENAREPLEDILKLASANSGSPAMREVADNARYSLNALN